MLDTKLDTRDLSGRQKWIWRIEMAGVKLLSETGCKICKPKAKVYYLNDGGGLRLRIRPDGIKTWIFRYYFHRQGRHVGAETGA